MSREEAAWCFRGKRLKERFCTSIKKYIVAYAAEMGGLDAIVFTAGIGENSNAIHKTSTEGLEFMGIKIDDAKNDGMRGKEVIISADNSRVKILVVPTNEELMIARDTQRLSAG